MSFVGWKRTRAVVVWERAREGSRNEDNVDEVKEERAKLRVAIEPKHSNDDVNSDEQATTTAMVATTCKDANAEKRRRHREKRKQKTTSNTFSLPS